MKMYDASHAATAAIGFIYIAALYLISHDMASWKGSELLAAAPNWLRPVVVPIPPLVRVAIHRATICVATYVPMIACLVHAGTCFLDPRTPVATTVDAWILRSSMVVASIFYLVFRPLRHDSATGFSPTAAAVATCGDFDTADEFEFHPAGTFR